MSTWSDSRTLTPVPRATEVGAVNAASVAERRLATSVIACLYAYLVAEPIVTYVSVRDADYAGISLRVHALLYGPPLLLALFQAQGVRQRGTFPLSDVLDPIARIMTVYWIVCTAIGFGFENPPGFWASDSFNFQIPCIAYFALRRITSEAQIDRLAKHLIVAAVINLPLSLGATYYSLVVKDFVGAGGILYIIPLCAGVALLARGSWSAGLTVVVLAIANNILSMKRAEWLVICVFPFLYMLVSGIAIRRVAQLATLLAAIGGIAWFGVTLLPQEAAPDEIAVRAESTETETSDFTSGQAREDEARSIWHAVDGEGLTATLFGLGTGATYTYLAETTSGEVIHDYHNSHFTPMGWVLRGGLVGLLINGSFYALMLVSAMMCISGRLRQRRASWQPAFVTFSILAVAVCVTSFSLTPNPAIHIILMLVLLRCSGERVVALRS